jgi:hypothetical protein
MTTPSLDDELQELRRAVTRSREAVAEGAFVNLSGLDAAVARLTEAVRTAPAVSRASLLATLDALLRELDGLAVDLQRQHDAALAQHATGVYGRD